MQLLSFPTSHTAGQPGTLEEVGSGFQGGLYPFLRSKKWGVKINKRLINIMRGKRLNLCGLTKTR